LVYFETMSTQWMLFLVATLTGCGARTGLLLDEVVEPRPDADTPDSSILDAGLSDSSTPDADTPSEELCNGLDDDGDGLIDEGFAPIRCGIGRCMREVPGCEDGVVPLCVPGEAVPEACNHLDDDCDGMIDEGLGFGEVAGPYVIRPAREGSAGDCSSCAWAHVVALADTPEGMLALWLLGFDGSYPEPNAFRRMLDSDGRPAGDIELLTERNLLRVQLLPGPEDQVLLVHCVRTRSDDYAATVFLDGTGEVLGEPEIRFDEPGCGWASTLVPYRQAHALSAFQAGTASPVYELMDWEARSLGSHHVEWENTSLPTFAANEVGVAMVHSVERSAEQFLFQLLDFTGAPVTEPELVGLEGFEHRGPGVASDGVRWLVITSDDYGGGFVRTWFEQGGGVSAEPTLSEPEVHPSRVQLLRYQDGFLLSGYGSIHEPLRYFLFVWRLDAEGEVTDRWEMTEGDFRDPPAFVVRDGRVFMLYSTGGFEGSRVELRELGCVE